MPTITAGDQCNFFHCESAPTPVPGDQCNFPQPDPCKTATISAVVSVSGGFEISHVQAATISAVVAVTGRVSILGAYPVIPDGDYRQPFVTPNRGEVRFKPPVVGRYE